VTRPRAEAPSLASLECTSEGELIPMAEAFDVGVLPWSPLRGGLLSGKYVRDGATPVDSLRPARHNEPNERDWDVIDAVADVAAKVGVSSAEVALAWVRSRPAVTSARSGIMPVAVSLSNAPPTATASSLMSPEPDRSQTLEMTHPRSRWMIVLTHGFGWVVSEKAASWGPSARRRRRLKPWS
jgi:hypothetical protein